MELINKEETISLRNRHIGQSCQLFFREDPLKIVRGQAQYLYDEKNEAYLDTMNNVAHVGHCHPKVVKAGIEQMSVLNTNNRFLHDNIVVCAKKILATMPEDLSVVYFVNSGSEANDLALRLAQIHTGNKDVITLEHAYHGHLTSLIDISHYKFNLPGGVGQKNHVHLASIPDVYRGIFRAGEVDNPTAGYVDEIGDMCRKNAGKMSAFIAESMLSCGGQVLLPPGYLHGVYNHVRSAGGVCIADEVQTGFGRVGKHYWAFELQGVVPDIVTIGKPMGNGHPVAAVVVRKEIADSFTRTGVEYFNTYGGNPVSCAIANAVMDVIEEENLRENALVVGEYLLDLCHDLKKKHALIGDVRGVGLFIGLELVMDRGTKEPATKIAQFMTRQLKKSHILMSVDGPFNNVLKMKPPMIFTKQNADEVFATLDRLFKEVKENPEFSVLMSSQVSRTRTDSCSKEARMKPTLGKEAVIKSI